MPLNDWYYSKALDRSFPTRLDFLIYAHDGRGLGHASRSIAIGMALRRLFPERRTLLVSGSKAAGALIGPAPLDWIKLPSYETTVTQGKVEGADGDSRFYKSVLGQLRAELLASIARTFRPRCVLVDFAPSGRKDELLRALEETKGSDTCWVLGLRAVIGNDEDVWSDEMVRLVKERYRSILWYGDASVLGPDGSKAIEDHFGARPLEMGYVSRLAEIQHWAAPKKERLAGTVSVPWGSETTWAFLRHIQRAIASLGDRHGRWRLFVAKEKLGAVQELFESLPFCAVDPVGEDYVPSVLSSKVALLYGGYNSITDVLAARVPAVVLLRDVKDAEQDDHLRRLAASLGESLEVLGESTADAAALQAALERQLRARPRPDQAINLRGAQAAAQALAETLPPERPPRT